MLKIFEFELPSIDFVPVSKHKREVVLVVENSQSRFLFHEKEYYQGVLRLPSGKIEKGEDPIYAGHRELEEETSIKLDNVFIPIGEISYFYKAKKIFSSYILFTRIMGNPELHPDRIHEKIIKFEWLGIDIFPSVIETLNSYSKEKDWGNFRALQHKAVFLMLQEHNSVLDN